MECSHCLPQAIHSIINIRFTWVSEMHITIKLKAKAMASYQVQKNAREVFRPGVFQWLTIYQLVQDACACLPKSRVIASRLSMSPYTDFS
jgi:hypothetical protein